MSLVLKFWKIVNNKSTAAYIHLLDDDRKPITSGNDHHLLFFKQFCEVFEFDLPKPASMNKNVHFQTLTADTKSSLSQTLYSIIDFCNKMFQDLEVKYFLLGRLKSYSLEGEFGVYRGLFGGLYHIAFEQILIGARYEQMSCIMR